jgi:putative FmdB family regulatory protein
MPLYEFKCESCSKVHEIMQRFSDPHPAHCPECQGSLTKLISMSSFALKGTGWYTTDYKRKAPAAPAPTPDAATSSSEAPSSSSPKAAPVPQAGATGTGATGTGASTSASNGS